MKTKQMWVLVTQRGRVCWETVAATQEGVLYNAGPFVSGDVARLGYRFARVTCTVEEA